MQLIYQNKKNTVAKKIVFNIMLLAMLHSTFVAPAQGIIHAYFNNEKGLNYTGFKKLVSDEPSNLLNASDTDVIKTTSKKVEKKSRLGFIDFVDEDNIIYADIKHGFIGVSPKKPLDDVTDNLFKVNIPNLANNNNKKVYLTYELFGLQDYQSVPKRINERLSTGGHVVKRNQIWTMQREEINRAWLHEGENTFMFGVPEGLNVQYEIRNLKIEFSGEDSNNFNTVLVASNPNIKFIKDNKIYLKGFLRNLPSMEGVAVFIEDMPLTLTDGEFEGFLELNKLLKKRKFAVLKAYDQKTLLGQEIIDLDNLVEADQLLPIEFNLEKNSVLVDANNGGTLKLANASITVTDSAMTNNTVLSITKLRKVDVAPMASGMINVTKGGTAYRFLPDGIKFKKNNKISIGYNVDLIPKGYSAKDIRTFYFNTSSKSWIPISRDSINEKEQTIISSTNHFTDYVNGIIQSPESPETSGFTPTLMSGISAADPSSEITLISPPSVSQTGEAGISYPIKIPSGRNGMQPNINLNYNSDAGSGWLGQGWNINIPAITIDTRWGAPAINNTNETVIYTLGGEQLMYPKFKNADNVYVDWMPNRQYDSTATVISTSARPKIAEADAKFTPRKQGSFAKIERLGNSPTNYYWKVTNTDGTISWYGGKTGVVENAVLKNSSNQIVYWSLYMTEDVNTNNVKYTYTKTPTASNLTGDKASLSSGIIYNIEKINYTGFNNAAGLYEIYFKRSAFTTLRTDATIDARLGLKIIDPCKLEEIIIRRTGSSSMIRKYKFYFKQGEFQKTLLDYVAEITSDNTEFYKHTFDYYNDVRESPTSDLVLFDRSYEVTLPNYQNPSPKFNLGVGNLIGYSKLNTIESEEAGWGVNLSGGVEFRLGKHSNDPSATITLNFPLGESYPNDRGMITMTDIDGDGLDDLIYKANDGLKYFSGGIDEEGKVFYNGTFKNISGVANFSRSKGRTKTMFLESHNLRLQVPFSKKEFFYGKFRTKSKVDTEIYFADGNGDGLIDIVQDKMVLFNQAASVDGGRQFGKSSLSSPNMLITANANVIPDILYPDDDTIQDPQGFDAVRVWIAPKNGLIKIQDSVLLNHTSNASATHYSIETSVSTMNNGLPFRLYLTQLTAANPSAIVSITNYSGNNPALGAANSSLLNVVRGQKIFFRISKNNSDINDEVVTNPKIIYLNEQNSPALIDENMINHQESLYNDGFILSADQSFKINAPGCLTISWNPIAINALNDDVTYRIMMQTDSSEDGDFQFGGGTNGEEELFKQRIFLNTNGSITVNGNQSTSGPDLNDPICFEAPSGVGKDTIFVGRSIRFEVYSPSNLKWKEIQWKPKIVFVPDASQAPQGALSIPQTNYPVAKYSIYKTNLQRKLAPATGWTIPNSAQVYTIMPNTTILDNSILNSDDFGSFRMVVKKNGQWVGTRVVSINNGVISVNNSSPINLSSAINLNNSASQFYYSVGYYMDSHRDEQLFKKYVLATKTALLERTAKLSYVGASGAASNTSFIYVESNFNNLEPLGPFHKEWGQFFYNDELDSSGMPFDSIGKLINPNIGNRYDALTSAFSDQYVDPNDPCFEGGTDEEIKDCLGDTYINSLNLPTEAQITPTTIDNIEINTFLTPSIQQALITPLLTARAVRKYPIIGGNPVEVEKWIGLFDTQFVQALKMKSGSFAGSEFDLIFPDDEDGSIGQADMKTGMQAITKQRQSVSVTKTVGWGPINLSSSKSSYSDTTSDFMDINGDRYPDLLSSQKMQLSNMTGGHKAILNQNYGLLHKSNNEAIRLVVRGGSQDLGRKEGPKTKTSSEKTTESNTNTGPPPESTTAETANPDAASATDASTNKKDDQGNPSFYRSIDADVNLSAWNEERELWTDLNGDGLPDKINPASNGSGFEFRLNNGGTFNSTPLNYNFLTTAYSKPSVLGINLSVGTAINSLLQGPTQEAPDAAQVNLNINFSAGLSTSGSNSTSVLLDINGDGLPDVLDVTENVGTYKLNTGSGFTSISQPLKTTDNTSLTLHGESKNTAVSIGGEIGLYAGFTICCNIVFLYIPILHVKAGIAVNGNANLSISNTEKAFKDINGDGYIDYVTRKNNSTFEVFPSKIARTNKLKTVTNPLKGSFTIDYKVQKRDFNNPNPKWALTSVKVVDGYDLAEDGVDTYLNTYSYENGRYDRRERTFYGYETIKSSNGIKFTVSKFHNQNYFLSGLLKESYVQHEENSASKISGIENIYELRQLSDTNAKMTTTVLPNTYDAGGTEGRRSAAAVLVSTKNYLYEYSTTPQITTEVTFVYDEYGRVSTSNNLGDLAESGDNYSSTITYHNDPVLIGKHILNIPSSITVTGTDMLRKRTTTVDNATGNILTVNAYIDDSEFVTTSMEYDAYGNLIYKEMPAESTNEAMFFNYTYDTNHYKILSITDAFDYVSEISYYLPTESSNHWYFDTGKIRETTDITGSQMRYEYDNFGRTTAIISPKELGTPYKTMRFEYHYKHTQPLVALGVTAASFVPFAVTSHYDPQRPTNDIQTITFMDGLARTVQIKKDIALNLGTAQSPNYMEYFSTSGPITYDAFGRPFKQYHPVAEFKSASTQFKYNQTVASFHTKTIYDVVDRPISSTDAAGNNSNIEYSIGSDYQETVALKTRIVVQQNATQYITSETYKDVQGRVISTMNQGDDDIWTRFKYNEVGDLLEYVDAEELATNYEYDLLGRKLQVIHPDQGTTKYTYNKSSNVTELFTAKLANAGESIKYVYGRTRLKQILYPETPSGQNISNVDFTYGDATLSGADATNRGRLIMQVDGSGVQHFTYGNMGELLKNRRTVVGPNIPTREFETSFEYDSWNRLQNMIYPDGERVQYEYDLGGNLNRIESDLLTYVQRIDYDHFEQRTYLLYGNNTETFYNYEPELRRLKNLNVLDSQQSMLLQGTYQYDKVGNITQFSNNAGVSSNGMGGTYLNDYWYDKLNRLSNARGNFNGEPTNSESDFQSNYETHLTYNNTHGIAFKQQYHIKDNVTYDPNTYQNTYTYQEGTHRLEQIEGSTATEIFGYDLNGNMTARDHSETGGAEYKWDESNRLRVVKNSNSGFMQHSIYDGSGERVLKASSHFEQVYENGSLIDPNVTFDGYTTYPSAFIVIDPNGIYSKHYYAGTQRIVSRLGDESADIFNIGANRPAEEKSTTSQETKEVDETAIRNVQVNDLKAYLEDFKLGTVSFKEYKASTYQEEEALLAEELKENREEKDVEQQRAPAVAPVYFYHPDHLGSSTFLTDANGMAYQFFLNLPFGETMAQQLPDSYYRTPFKFNGKELDEETGLYYYGARYYDPKISIWLSVDPLVERFPATNPYVYCFDNPINMVDPDGRAPLWIFRFDSKGNMTVVNDGKSNILIETSKGTFAPSKVDKSRSSLKALAKITAYFAGKKDFGGRKVKLSTKDMGSTGGFYNPKDDSMTLLYSAFKSGIFDNANNLNSTLNHEIGKLGHRGEDHSIPATYLGHANVYRNETTQPEFSGTSDIYKYSTAVGFAERVFNAYLNGEIGHNQEEQIINSFNKSNAHQIYIDYHSWNGNGSAEIFIKGKSFGKTEFDVLDTPQD